MKRKIVAFILIITLFIVGCTPVVCDEPYIRFGDGCCLDDNSNSICDSDESNTNQKDTNIQTPPTNTQKQVNQPTASYSSYGLEDVKKNVETVFQEDYVWEQDEEFPQFHNAQLNKYIFIEELDSQINSPSDFSAQFTAPNWEIGWYLLDGENLDLSHEPLDESYFRSEQDYKEYNTYGTHITQKTIEKEFELDNGKVLEYQHINWAADSFNNFQGAWEDTLLIYKVYCSPDYIIYIRPNNKDLRIGVLGSIEETTSNWEGLVQRVRNEMLPKVDRILSSCPVDSSFFDNIPKVSHDQTKELMFYLDVEYEYFWDLETEVSVEILPSEKEGHYILDKVEVTLENKGERIKEDVDININVLFEGDSEKFVSGKTLAGQLLTDKPVTKVYSSDTGSIEFTDIIELEIIPYLSTGPRLRPTSYTVTSDGTVKTN